MDSCHIVTLLGFELGSDAEVLTPAPLPSRKIEVFGDSVSCGEVSEAVDYVGKPDPEHDGEYSNSWYSYAWMTARNLHAQLHDSSQGGIALLDKTGWFMAPDYLGIESCYDKIEYQPELSEVKPWDFSAIHRMLSFWHLDKTTITRTIIWRRIITVHVLRTGGSITADFWSISWNYIRRQPLY